jgi:hypothetical protein
MSSPPRRTAIAKKLKMFQSIGQYFALLAIFGIVALALALGWAGWTPRTWMDWLMIIGLTPAGVGGALIGDRIGLWLKDHGFGRQ